VIERLDLGDPTTAREVLALQRAAYRVEADLTGVEGIPPLHESLEELVAAPLQWIGIRDDGRLSAALAMTGEARSCDIDRLVVDPAWHRQGLGRRLISSVLHHEVVTVSTLERNVPGVELYRSLGFDVSGRREVGPGAWTVQFEYRHAHLKTSFDADVAGYEAIRPGYPDELFDVLAARCGLVRGARVVEIGPGTGQATLSMLARGVSIVAVEPGPAMAARLRERTAGLPCEVVQSDFESSTLTGPFDLAVAATSFHWVDAAKGIDKLAALIPPGQWIALWWNVFRDSGPHDEEFQALLRPITERFQTEERMGATTFGLDHPARRLDIEAGQRFELVDSPSFEWWITYDAPSMRALFATFSDWSTLPEPDRGRALDGVASIVEDHFGGSIARRYLTQAYLARRS
jgi:SAM-dependent methyltransferase/GNAT superfamily N-acetyltransferase